MRELRNLVERLTILSPGRSISPADIPLAPIPAAPSLPASGAGAPRSIEAELEASERALVLSALRQAEGHRGRAASVLGISRHALKRRLQRLGIP